MTDEETFKHLFNIESNCDYDITLDEKQAISLAYRAIEKQMPKKPVEDKIDSWKCPNCHAKHLHFDWYFDDGEFEFCPKCGQSIDWSDYI